MAGAVNERWLFDASGYIRVLRDRGFAEQCFLDATVVTANREDFRQILRWRTFRLELL